MYRLSANIGVGFRLHPVEFLFCFFLKQNMPFSGSSIPLSYRSMAAIRFHWRLRKRLDNEINPIRSYQKFLKTIFFFVAIFLWYTMSTEEEDVV